MLKVVVPRQRRLPKDPAIQEGKPLPSFGTCKHYKKSYRWLRFPCCGKAYPCDACHDANEDHEMKLANRMICGFCCKEQVSFPVSTIQPLHYPVGMRLLIICFQVASLFFSDIQPFIFSIYLHIFFAARIMVPTTFLYLIIFFTFLSQYPLLMYMSIFDDACHCSFCLHVNFCIYYYGKSGLV